MHIDNVLCRSEINKSVFIYRKRTKVFVTFVNSIDVHIFSRLQEEYPAVPGQHIFMLLVSFDVRAVYLSNLSGMRRFYCPMSNYWIYAEVLNI